VVVGMARREVGMAVAAAGGSEGAAGALRANGLGKQQCLLARQLILRRLLVSEIWSPDSSMLHNLLERSVVSIFSREG